MGAGHPTIMSCLFVSWRLARPPSTSCGQRPRPTVLTPTAVPRSPASNSAITSSSEACPSCGEGAFGPSVVVFGPAQFPPSLWEPPNKSLAPRAWTRSED